MDGSQNGGRDSRYSMGYDLPPLLNTDGTTNEIYNATAAGVMHGSGAGRQTINSNLVSRVSNPSSVSLSNSCSASLRGIKRNSSDMCYDQNMSTSASRSTTMLNMSEDCSPVMMENNYSPSSNQKCSPPSNGKKTKGRVKIKMEYIDNKLRRYTTFSKRKTGIMKKAYELSTLTGTQVMLLVASETGHVYTFATRKLQPMITSEAGKALIQTCLNSPDPFPTGTGDQRMSATGFEETELSYNVADDEKADSISSSPYHTDSSDSSDTESISPSSPMTCVASTSSANAACSAINDDAVTITPIFSINGRSGKSVQSSMPGLVPLQQVQNNNNNNNNSTTAATSISTTNDGSKVLRLKNIDNDVTITPTILYSSGGSDANNSLICSFEQLEREFGIQAPRVPGGPHFIKIPLPNDVQSIMTQPPAAHQTPADLSNKSRR